MNIIVCIKQVPDSTRVKVDPKTSTLVRAGVPSILNPYDHFALSQALKIKAKTGANITVLSMGPQQAVSVIRLALGLGADKGILLSDRAFAGSDTWATSYALAAAIKKTGNFDLILCGQMAIDGDTAQTGPGIAYHLDIPQITFCDSADIEGRVVRAGKIIDGGHQLMEADLPALVTMTMPFDYAPAYPSLMGAFKAQQKPLEVWTAAQIGADPAKLGLEGSPTRVDRIFPPPARPKGQIFSGSAGELADTLIEILKKEGVIK
ncbi:MAG: electron transfer flavoprotein subunit beta/FixA family protein [Elusimicrobiota bacterium]|jgi:electron transfer flavoprotein beta subunit|nr:electron transfer flavoprotein subunit beta/FixA family protein [Elusimicrobiota bacterium]